MARPKKETCKRRKRLYHPKHKRIRKASFNPKPRILTLTPIRTPIKTPLQPHEPIALKTPPSDNRRPWKRLCISDEDVRGVSDTPVLMDDEHDVAEPDDLFFV